MRLESWKQRWTGHGGQNVRSFSVDTESELDERDLRICYRIISMRLHKTHQRYRNSCIPDIRQLIIF